MSQTKSLLEAKIEELTQMVANNSKRNQELLDSLDRVHEKVLRLKAEMENPRRLGESG